MPEAQKVLRARIIDSTNAPRVKENSGIMRAKKPQR
jgi:hypothetical protein